jgi:hypothetical protein
MYLLQYFYDNSIAMLQYLFTIHKQNKIIVKVYENINIKYD